MKRLWNKLLDWTVKLKFPFFFDYGASNAWRWYGGYGNPLFEKTSSIWTFE